MEISSSPLNSHWTQVSVCWRTQLFLWYFNCQPGGHGHVLARRIEGLKPSWWVPGIFPVSFLQFSQLVVTASLQSVLALPGLSRWENSWMVRKVTADPVGSFRVSWEGISWDRETVRRSERELSIVKRNLTHLLGFLNYLISRLDERPLLQLYRGQTRSPSRGSRLWSPRMGTRQAPALQGNTKL